MQEVFSVFLKTVASPVHIPFWFGAKHDMDLPAAQSLSICRYAKKMYAGRFCGWLLGRLHCHSAVLRGEAAVAVEIRVRDSAKTSLPSMHFVATPLFSFLAYSPESPSELKESRIIRSGLRRLRFSTGQKWPFAQSVTPMCFATSQPVRWIEGALNPKNPDA